MLRKLAIAMAAVSAVTLGSTFGASVMLAIVKDGA